MSRLSFLGVSDDLGENLVGIDALGFPLESLNDAVAQRRIEDLADPSLHAAAVGKRALAPKIIRWDRRAGTKRKYCFIASFLVPFSRAE